MESGRKSGTDQEEQAKHGNQAADPLERASTSGAPVEWWSCGATFSAPRRERFWYGAGFRQPEGPRQGGHRQRT
jgi:hypothetical protein